MHIGTVHYPKYYYVVTENPLDCRKIIRKLMYQNCAFGFFAYMYMFMKCVGKQINKSISLWRCILKCSLINFVIHLHIMPLVIWEGRTKVYPSIL